MFTFNDLLMQELILPVKRQTLFILCSRQIALSVLLFCTRVQVHINLTIFTIQTLCSTYSCKHLIQPSLLTICLTELLYRQQATSVQSQSAARAAIY